MSGLLANLGVLVAAYGYWVLFPIAVVEGPIIGLLAGAFAATGQLNPFVLFIVLLVADVVGDVLYYLLGRWSNNKFARKLIQRLGLANGKFETIQKQFREHDVKIILFGKTQAWGSVILYFAGTLRMSFWRFVVWNTIGTVPKVLLFEVAGYFIGQSLAESEHYLGIAGIATFVIGALLIGGYFLFKRYLGKLV